MAEIYENKKVIGAVTNMKVMMSEFGIAPGDEMWAIHSLCHNCPEEDDHCGIGCNKRGKKYLEKVTVKEVKLVIRKKDFYIKFTDNNEDDYVASDINNNIFKNREEALARL